MSHRILHVVDSVDRYAPATDLLAVAKGLPVGEWESHVVVLGHPGPLAKSFAEADLQPKYLERRWAYDPTTLLRLIAHLRSVRPDVVHSWDAVSREYAELAVRWGGDPPLVAQCHQLWLGEPRLRWPAPQRWRHAADRLVVDSQALREVQQPFVPAHAACEVVAPGVAPSGETTTTREQWLDELQLPHQARLIAVAGPLLPRFGVKELIWAADMVRVLHPNIQFLILGDGPQRTHLERFAHTAAESQNICFIGDTQGWPEVARHLDIYWQGTEPHATSPTTLLDAMAAGVPVVASDIPPHREIIQPGENGYLVGIEARAERTRATDLLLNDAVTARAIGNAGRDRVLREFSLTARCEHFAQIYGNLLA